MFQSDQYCILIQTKEFLSIVGYIEQQDNLYQKYCNAKGLF